MCHNYSAFEKGWFSVRCNLRASNKLYTSVRKEGGLINVESAGSGSIKERGCSNKTQESDIPTMKGR